MNGFSQPDEVLPCDEPLYVPNASLDCTCGSGNAQNGCCHQIANVSTNLTWVSSGARCSLLAYVSRTFELIFVRASSIGEGPCVGGVPTPQYCTKEIGGMVGEGSNCASPHAITLGSIKRRNVLDLFDRLLVM